MPHKCCKLTVYGREIDTTADRLWLVLGLLTLTQLNPDINYVIACRQIVTCMDMVSPPKNVPVATVLLCTHTRHHKCGVTSWSYTDSLTLCSYKASLYFSFADIFPATLLTVTVNFPGCLPFYVMCLTLNILQPLVLLRRFWLAETFLHCQRACLIIVSVMYQAMWYVVKY